MLLYTAYNIQHAHIYCISNKVYALWLSMAINFVGQLVKPNYIFVVMYLYTYLLYKYMYKSCGLLYFMHKFTTRWKHSRCAPNYICVCVIANARTRSPATITQTKNIKNEQTEYARYTRRYTIKYCKADADFSLFFFCNSKGRWRQNRPGKCVKCEKNGTTEWRWMNQNGPN